MPSFTETIEVAADPNTAWQVLGDLATVDRWVPGITKVELDGTTRVCTFADGHTQREAILDYSPAARSYRYTIDGGLPSPTTAAASRSSLPATAPGSSGSRASWSSTRPPRRLSASYGPAWCRSCSAGSRPSSSSADQRLAIMAGRRRSACSGVQR
jgi:Polyketide cyclase / dehydrase and lipid transport